MKENPDRKKRVKSHETMQGKNENPISNYHRQIILEITLELSSEYWIKETIVGKMIKKPALL